MEIENVDIHSSQKMKEMATKDGPKKEVTKKKKWSLSRRKRKERSESK